MEVVAAAASVAGIITLVFQSIDGLTRFKELFADASSASRTINRLLGDINSLIQTLENVRDVLEQFEAQKKEKNFASLDIKLADCSRDVHVWIATAKILRPSAEHGGKAWLKKFRLAVNSNGIQTIRDEIGRHRQALCLSLTVLGRYYRGYPECKFYDVNARSRTIDLHTSEQIHQIGGKFDQSLSSHGTQEETLKRIEHYSRASLASSTHSVQSMNTIRGELSRLEGLISNANVGQTPGIMSKHQFNGQPQIEQYGKDPEATTLASQAASSADAPRKGGDKCENNICNASNLCQHEQHPGSTRSEVYMDEVDLVSNWSTTDGNISVSESGFIYAKISSSRKSFEVHRDNDFKDQNFPLRRKPIKSPVDFVQSDASFRSPKPDIKGNRVDFSSIHQQLLQSTLERFPSVVADYVSACRLIAMFEGHLHLLEVLRYDQAASLPLEKCDVGHAPASAQKTLRDQLKELRRSLRLMRKRCIQAGHSLAEIDMVLRPQITKSAPDDAALLTDTDDEDWKDAVES